MFTYLRRKAEALAGAEDGAEREHAGLDGVDFAIQFFEFLIGRSHFVVGVAPAVDLILAKLEGGTKGAELVHDLIFAWSWGRRRQYGGGGEGVHKKGRRNEGG